MSRTAVWRSGDSRPGRRTQNNVCQLLLSAYRPSPWLHQLIMQGADFPLVSLLPPIPSACWFLILISFSLFLQTTGENPLFFRAFERNATVTFVLKLWGWKPMGFMFYSRAAFSQVFSSRSWKLRSLAQFEYSSSTEIFTMTGIFFFSINFNAVRLFLLQVHG